MNKYVLILDESGAKAFSNKEEQYAGEFGLMCGLLVPEILLPEIRELAENSFSVFSQDGKLHLTDLRQEEQHTVREIFYDILKSRNLSWCYEAIYSQGLYESENNEDRGGGGERVLLHSELFLGVFFKSVFKLASMGEKIYVLGL